MLLLQVVENLLSNAVKFVAPGVSPRVSIRAERKDALVRVWVEDNGIGIPAQYHDRVFGVFERLNRPEEYPGTGIGLAIVRRAVQRMDGRIGFESEVGRGSRFWIELSAAV
ncbi:MAG TPA: ATP-binding protein [Planctomycetota bacterium]|nr:ATP-binding protein [Planctomycetota bacterium]